MTNKSQSVTVGHPPPPGPSADREGCSRGCRDRGRCGAVQGRAGKVGSDALTPRAALFAERLLTIFRYVCGGFRFGYV